MDDKPVTRSSNHGMNTGHTLAEGVGARHKATPNPAGGGGYLDIYTDCDVSEKKFSDPRLDELVDARIGGFWLSLANEIGFDAFLLVWQRLCDRASTSDDGHRVYVPRYDSFVRYQRNRFIVSLSNSGLKSKQIRERVLKDLNEEVSSDHINKLIRQYMRK